MQQFRAVILRFAVLTVLYAITVQAMLAQACPLSHMTGQTALCGQNTAGDHSPADGGACCALSCCLMVGTGGTPPSPIMVHAPMRAIHKAAWAGIKSGLTYSRIVARAYATGPPFILDRIAM